MEAAARATPATAGPVYTRRQPEKAALFQVMQQHLLTFEETLGAVGGRLYPLHRNEIDRLANKVREKGLTLVPLSLYRKKGRVKVELALVHG